MKPKWIPIANINQTGSRITTQRLLQAPFGCKWYGEWTKKVHQCEDWNQKAVVVYKKGKTGIKTSAGLGNSQRKEVEYLEKHFPDKGYREIDATDFEVQVSQEHFARIHMFTSRIILRTPMLTHPYLHTRIMLHTPIYSYTRTFICAHHTSNTGTHTPAPSYAHRTSHTRTLTPIPPFAHRTSHTHTHMSLHTRITLHTPILTTTTFLRASHFIHPYSSHPTLSG
jgi:hypothetical protein